jgi:hypothetical protein
VARGAWRSLTGRGEIVECEAAGESCAMPAGADAELGREPSGGPDVRLLPAYDNYLVGYRSRALAVAAEFERQVWPGGGQIRPTVTVDGQVVGTWSRRDGGRSVQVSLFGDVPPAVAAGIAAESADVSRFLRPAA